MNAKVAISIEDAKRDPWFWICVQEAIETDGIVENFCRLNGYAVPNSTIERMIDSATGVLSQQAKDFVQFVFDAVYMRIPRPS